MSRTYWILLLALVLCTIVFVVIPLAHADLYGNAKQLDDCQKGIISAPQQTICFLMAIYFQGMDREIQTDKLIQLQEQENKLLAMNLCVPSYIGGAHFENDFRGLSTYQDCVSQVLNDTK